MRWLALVVALSGCGKTRTCKSGTLYVSVDLDGSAGADNLSVVVIVGGVSGQMHNLDHQPADAHGAIEIDFPSGYRPGTEVEVAIAATLGGMVIGSGDGKLQLPPGCGTLAITVGLNPDAGEDLSVPLEDLSVALEDSAALPDQTSDEAADLTSPPDLACLGCGDGSICCAGACTTIDTANCGQCGAACDTTLGHSSSASCVERDGGTFLCAYNCTAPFADCDPDVAPNTNGCEANLNTDKQHCGACASRCDTLRSSGASCSGGNCVYSGCQPYFADCSAAGHDVDGCETDTTRAATCGGCAACAPTNNTARNCLPLDGGVATCAYACSNPFANCNPTPPNTGGCTTNISSDVNNCTACGMACNKMTGTPTCNGTRCIYTCNPGAADCNSSGVDTNGCECPTSTTPPDGGCCGTGCQIPHDNGVGQSYFDCTSTGTYNVTQAFKACVAFTGLLSKCKVVTCASGGLVICDTGTPNCNCWQYTGAQIGHVFNGYPLNDGCLCPGAGWPTWN